MICERDTDKSRYFAITEFNMFYHSIFGKQWDLPFLTEEWSQEGEKCGFMSRIILFAAKHSRTTLHMCRPLFVGSYLQVMWWAFSQWKGRKICVNNDKHVYYLVNLLSSTLFRFCWKCWSPLESSLSGSIF